MNKGELPMYLVDGMYEPLITKEDFDRAQEIRQERADAMPEHETTAFSGKVKCKYCGCGVSRRTRGGRKVWICNTRDRKGMAACDLIPLAEDELCGYAEKAGGRFAQIILGNADLAFRRGNGTVRMIPRTYTGERGSNPFTRKIFCGCGRMMERDNRNGKRVWCCRGCGLKRLPEANLIEAASAILGDRWQGRVAEEIKNIDVRDKDLTFLFKTGEVITWQRT